MAERKTFVNKNSVAAFVAKVKDADERADCNAIIAIMEAATKSKAKMWGTAIIGFGEKEVLYAGGKTATWMKIGFSPRKGNFALYGLSGAAEDAALMEKLGKHSRGKGCVYIKQLSDVHVPALKKLVGEAVKGSA
jgi:uncharacterized protein DUF1801